MASVFYDLMAAQCGSEISHEFYEAWRFSSLRKLCCGHHETVGNKCNQDSRLSLWTKKFSLSSAPRLWEFFLWVWNYKFKCLERFPLQNKSFTKQCFELFFKGDIPFAALYILKFRTKSSKITFRKFGNLIYICFQWF